MTTPTTSTTTTTTPTTSTTSTTTAVLITGANKGLGAGTAQRLAALGWTVWMGARDVAAAHATADRIREEQPGADLRPVTLDVTSDESVASAYDVVAASGTGLDVLVNNAGIIGGGRDALGTDVADLLRVYDVNVFGPVRMTRAFAPLLGASRRPRIVMVSSGLGSVEHVNDPDRIESQVPGIAYQSSKAALDMIATQYAKVLPAARVCSVDPGYTATDLNGHSGPQTIAEGTDAIVAAASADEVPGWRFDRDALA